LAFFDGRSDILWRNDNGDVTDWLGQANGGFASDFGNAFYHVAIGVSAYWSIFDHCQGPAFTLWQHPAAIPVTER
jgi:hypothetical protein